MAKSKIKKNYIIEKSNALNEMRSNNMTLQELRLLSIYMSKINARDKSTSAVQFLLADLHAIMDVDMKGIRASYYSDIAESLLHKIVKIPYRGGFKAFSLFKRVVFARNDENLYYFGLEAHEDSLPLLFDLKGDYFKYELWNALRLRGKNQLRMYEVLKQYERAGCRIVLVEDLKEMLGIDKNDYPQFKYFKRDVLETCKKALAENTDISFTYEPHSKKGRKIHELKFTITKNKNYIDPLGLDKFIDLKNKPDYEDSSQDIDFDDIDENGNLHSTGTSPIYEERITYLMSACNNEFSREEIIVLFDIMPSWAKHDENDSHDFLQSKYREMDMRQPNQSRFGYLKKLISAEE
jgi:hypothetical protein